MPIKMKSFRLIDFVWSIYDLLMWVIIDPNVSL